MKRPHASSPTRSFLFVLMVVVVAKMAARAEAATRIDERLETVVPAGEYRDDTRKAAVPRRHERTKATRFGPETTRLRATTALTSKELRSKPINPTAAVDEAPTAPVVVMGDHTFAFDAPRADSGVRTAPRIDFIATESPATAAVTTETPTIAASQPPLDPVATDPPAAAPGSADSSLAPLVATDAPATASPTLDPTLTQVPTGAPRETVPPVMTSLPATAVVPTSSPPSNPDYQPDASPSSTRSSSYDVDNDLDGLLSFDDNVIATPSIDLVESEPDVISAISEADSDTGDHNPGSNDLNVSPVLDVKKNDSDENDPEGTSLLDGYKESGQDGVDDGDVDDINGFTLSPIASDMISPNAGVDITNNDHSKVEPSHASTMSKRSASFGGWKLALVIVGTVCAVLISVFFVHRRYVRHAAANKRDRGSSQQRALDSFFRQNRVTVPRDTGASSNSFASFLSRDRIGGIMSSRHLVHGRPCSFSNSAAQAALSRNARLNFTESINRPSTTNSGNLNDSYAGSSNSARLHSSNNFGSRSVFLTTGSVAVKSATPSPSLATRAESMARTRNEAAFAASTEDLRNTTQSSRSSGEFSIFNSSRVSVESNPYRISTQFIDVPTELSESSSSYPSYRLSDDESDVAGTDSFRTDVSVEDSSAISDSFASDR